MRSLAGAGRVLLRGCSRALSTPAAPEPLQLIRFVDAKGDEHFGTFTDASETHARIATRSPLSGKLGLTMETRDVDIILPPVDPPQIFAIGLNYADHAKEVI